MGDPMPSYTSPSAERSSMLYEGTVRLRAQDARLMRQPHVRLPQARNAGR